MNLLSDRETFESLVLMRSLRIGMLLALAMAASPTGKAFPQCGPLLPYDTQQPWVHGYGRAPSVYGGYHSFKPYNYRHVAVHSAMAARFGMPQSMPYSQSFWSRYEHASGFLPAQESPPPPLPPVPLPEPRTSLADPISSLPTAENALSSELEASTGVEVQTASDGPIIVPAASESGTARRVTRRSDRWAGWNGAPR